MIFAPTGTLNRHIKHFDEGISSFIFHHRAAHFILHVVFVHMSANASTPLAIDHDVQTAINGAALTVKKSCNPKDAKNHG